MQRQGGITRQLTRVLALVLTLVFSLSTFHVHAGTTSPDVVVAASIDGSAGAAEKAPDSDDRHGAVDCLICAGLSVALVGEPISQLHHLIVTQTRFALSHRVSVGWPPDQLHRPPIAASM